MVMIDTEIEGNHRYGLHKRDVGSMRLVGMLAFELDIEEEKAAAELQAKTIEAVKHPSSWAAEAAQPYLETTLFADTDH